MRSTIPALLGLALAASACVDVPHRHYFNADGGSDGGSAARDCSSAQLVTGDLTFSNADGALLLTGVPKSGSWKLAGKLTMTGSGVSSMVRLGDLCSVGDLEIANTNLKKIDTTGPIEVVGDVSVHDNDQLADLANIAPGADRIGSLLVEHNAALARFDSFGSLRYVTNATAIRYNDALATIDLHDVQRLEGGLDVSYDAALTSLQLSSLQSVGDLTLSHDTKLASVELGALQYVHGSLTIDSDDAIDLASIMTTAMIRVDLNLYITNDGNVTGLGQLAHTQSVGGVISISNNAQLDYCPAREVGCCVAHAGLATIANNLTAACNNGSHSWCYAQNNNTCPYQY